MFFAHAGARRRLAAAGSSAPRRDLGAVYFFVVLPIVARSFCCSAGAVLGLAIVETALWGGLLVTLVVAVGRHRRLAAARHPAGARPALEAAGRASCSRSIFIEFVRGVPLITVLFMASVMLPLFLPAGVDFDKLLRALIGVALFAVGLHGRGGARRPAGDPARASTRRAWRSASATGR